MSSRLVSGAPLGLMGLALLCSCTSETSPAESAKSSEPAALSPFSFVDEATLRGVRLEHAPHRSSEKLMPEVLGSGVAIADFNRDGAPDLYFVGGGNIQRLSGARSGSAADRLFLNDGQGSFRDASEAWGVAGAAYGMGVAVGDYDNDGWSDVLLTTYGGGDRLLRNTGKSFEDVSTTAGLSADPGWGTSAGFFDCDADGDLDVYVARYVEYDHKGAIKCWHNTRHIYCSPALFDALPDTLLRNNGDGTFTDISELAGVSAHPGKGLALALGDIDWDGDVDVFVANDLSRKLLFLNDGSGRFDERGQSYGVAYDEAGWASAGMGADFSDVDGNGLQDIACTNFQEETSNLYMQQSAGVFRDRSYALGVGESAQKRLSFGVDFCDLDNDGDEDLFVANGHMDDGIESVSDSVTFGQTNSLYVLAADGRFKECSAGSGPGLKPADVTRGVASGDLDGDGRIDIVLTTNGGAAQLLMNRSESGGAVILWLEGTASNRSAIGARVIAQVGETELRREVRGSSSYLSICDFRVHLGLGGAQQLSAARILWPSGTVQQVGQLAAGFYRVVEGRAPQPFEPGQQVIAPE